MAVARIKLSQQSSLYIGNLSARRVFLGGGASDVVQAIWLMLQSSFPRDYLVGIRKLRLVRGLLDCVFHAAGLDWKKFVLISHDHIRDEGIFQLVPKTSKLYDDLGWQPEISFQELMVQMVSRDIELFQSE
jgi:GDPmannose 4,6-dehydratase